MKMLKTMLAVALIAGGSTVAMAQGGGGGGGAGSDVNPNRVGRGTDANPTTPGASPELGNSAAPKADRVGNGRVHQSRKAMKTRNVSGKRATPRNSNSSNPAQIPAAR